MGGTIGQADAGKLNGDGYSIKGGSWDVSGAACPMYCHGAAY